MTTKIKKISDDAGIEFEDGSVLSSYHEQDCCESHYLDFSHIEKADYKDLEFDLSNDDFFNRIPQYGIELKPINNHPLRIPGYGYNNGYYGSDITLVLTLPDGTHRDYDVSDCQVIDE